MIISNIKIFLKKTFFHWFDEYQADSRYGLKGKLIIEKISDIQKITIIESLLYGKALLLNNCWMTAEFQEKQYHECLVHPALTSSEEIKKILIIGGGDGGTAKQCLLYKEVQHIDLVEIDNLVIKLSKKYLPSIGGNAWYDKRLNIKIEDGCKWIENCQDNSYDIVIIDGSDPVGPAEGLFNEKFFKDCYRILRKGGIFAMQSESPESFEKVHLETLKIIRKIFEYADPLYGHVSIYPSGYWSWIFGAKDSQRYNKPKAKRVKEISRFCEIWSPRWQNAAFNLITASLERKINQ